MGEGNDQEARRARRFIWNVFFEETPGPTKEFDVGRHRAPHPGGGDTLRFEGEDTRGTHGRKEEQTG